MTAPEVKNLSKADKKALAHIMHDNGYSFRQMEDYLGADHATISRWAKEEPDEQKMQQFATAHSREIGLHKRKIMFQVLQRLEQLVPEEKDIDKVVKAGQYVEAKGVSDKAQNNIQINFQALNKQVKDQYGEL